MVVDGYKDYNAFHKVGNPGCLNQRQKLVTNKGHNQDVKDIGDSERHQITHRPADPIRELYGHFNLHFLPRIRITLLYKKHVRNAR